MLCRNRASFFFLFVEDWGSSTSRTKWNRVLLFFFVVPFFFLKTWIYLVLLLLPSYCFFWAALWSDMCRLRTQFGSSDTWPARVQEGRNEWMNEWMNEWTDEWMGPKRNERMNDWQHRSQSAGRIDCSSNLASGGSASWQRLTEFGISTEFPFHWFDRHRFPSVLGHQIDEIKKWSWTAFTELPDR